MPHTFDGRTCDAEYEGNTYRPGRVLCYLNPGHRTEHAAIDFVRLPDGTATRLTPLSWPVTQTRTECGGA